MRLTLLPGLRTTYRRLWLAGLLVGTLIVAPHALPVRAATFTTTFIATLAQASNQSSQTVSRAAVVRAAGAILYAQPNGAEVAQAAAGAVVTPIGRTDDSQWIAVTTAVGEEGWLPVATLILFEVAQLPVVADTVMNNATMTDRPAVAAQATPVAMPSPTPSPVSSPTLAGVPVLPTPAAPLPATPGQTVVVRSGGTDLLAAPDGDLLRRVGPGTTLQAGGRTEDSGWVWVYLATDPEHPGDLGAGGWVAASELYLTNLTALPVVDANGTPQASPDTQAPIASDAAATPRAANPTTGIEVTVASGEERLNVRSGPGTAYAILAKALDGDRYTAIGRDATGNWLQIELDAMTTGWVSTTYLTIVGDVNALPMVEMADPQVTSPSAIPATATDHTVATASTNAPATASLATGLTGVLVIQSSPGGKIYGYNLATGATWPLANGFDPDISPDGSTVAFVRDGGAQGIYLIDIDGSNERLIFSGRQRLSSPKWSPDGAWLVFTRSDDFNECLVTGATCLDLALLPPDFDRDGEDVEISRRYTYNLARIDRDGQNYRDIASLNSARAADWNSAGIVYQSDAGLQLTADAPAAENQLLIFDYLKPFFADPDWQPNGGRIVYMGREASHTELFAVNPDGSSTTALTHPATTLVDEIPSNVAPAWSPDGERIVFVSNRAAEGEAGAWRLWVMDADGSNQRPLPVEIPMTYTYGAEQMVSWGPAF